MIEGVLLCNYAAIVEFRMLPVDGNCIEAPPKIIYNLTDASAESREAIRPSEPRLEGPDAFLFRRADPNCVSVLS